MNLSMLSNRASYGDYPLIFGDFVDSSIALMSQLLGPSLDISASPGGR